MKALVTGGCRGLGEAFTEELVARGYEVMATYHESEERAKEMEEKYKTLKCLKCDISNEEDIKNLFKEIGSIDLLINNAAIAIDNSFKDKTKDEFMKVIEINLVGTFLMIKYASDYLVENGVVINISSNNTLGNNSPLSMDYDASKAGVNMLTKNFSESLTNIKVIAYAPGWIDTESIREMNPEYLASEMQKCGQEKLIDPKYLAKYILDNYETLESGSIIEVKEI